MTGRLSSTSLAAPTATSLTSHAFQEQPSLSLPPAKKFDLTPTAIDLLAGTVAGWVQVIVGHPFDTIKVRLQTQGGSQRFAGLSQCCMITAREEGIRGFYKGVASPLVGVGICNAALFAIHGRVKDFMHAASSDASTHAYTSRLADPIFHFNAGFISGIAMALIQSPFELLKVKLQAQRFAAPGTEKYNGIWHAFTRTMQTSGPKGILRGMGATMARDPISFAAYFAVYEWCKARWQNPHSSPSSWVQLMAGGCAGIACWVVCFPQDVVKSRFQFDSSYKSYGQVIRKVLAQHGLRGFYQGFGACILRAFPANAATFWAYESISKQFTNSNQ